MTNSFAALLTPPCRLKQLRIPLPTLREVQKVGRRLVKTVTEFVASDDQIDQQLALKKSLRPDARTNIALDIEKAKEDVIRHTQDVEDRDKEVRSGRGRVRARGSGANSVRSETTEELRNNYGTWPSFMNKSSFATRFARR